MFLFGIFMLVAVLLLIYVLSKRQSRQVATRETCEPAICEHTKDVEQTAGYASGAVLLENHCLVRQPELEGENRSDLTKEDEPPWADWAVYGHYAQLRFVAPLDVWTPLRVLDLHGCIHDDQLSEPETPPIRDLYREYWFPETAKDKLGPRRIPSEIGPMPPDGGALLPLLKDIRTVAESVGAPDERADLLRQFLMGDARGALIERLGGVEGIINQLFPLFVYSIPGLPARSVAGLAEQGLLSPMEIEQLTDRELMSIKGIGPATIRKLREACDEAVFFNQSRVDWTGE